MPKKTLTYAQEIARNAEDLRQVRQQHAQQYLNGKSTGGSGSSTHRYGSGSGSTSHRYGAGSRPSTYRHGATSGSSSTARLNSEIDALRRQRDRLKIQALETEKARLEREVADLKISKSVNSIHARVSNSGTPAPPWYPVFVGVSNSSKGGTTNQGFSCDGAVQKNYKASQKQIQGNQQVIPVRPGRRVFNGFVC